MKSFAMDATFEAFGGFWTPDRPDEIITGTLAAEQGVIHLQTSPTYKNLSGSELSQAFLAYAQPSEPEEIETLWGRTTEGKCSLFWLHEMNNPGVTDLSAATQIGVSVHRVSAVVLGCHILSSSAETIDSAMYQFSHIKTAYQVPWVTEMKDHEISYTYSTNGITFFSYESLATDAEITFEVVALGGSKGRRAGFKSCPQILIKPNHPRSLEWFKEFGIRLENFFSLVLGTSIANKRIYLFQGDERGSLVLKTKGRAEKTNRQLWVKCDPAFLANPLERWLAVPEDARPVERILLGMIRKTSLFVETEFLSLAQSLESFGRVRFNDPLVPKERFHSLLTAVRSAIQTIAGVEPIVQRCMDSLTHANEPSFGEKIRQTYDLIPAELIPLFGDRDLFTKTIVRTRNFFTHLGISPTKYVVKGGKELFLLNQRLHAFLRCVMLVDLGFGEEHVRDPIAYQARRWS